MSPWQIDLVLIFMVIEAACLRLWFRWSAGAVAALLLPGACLVLALRAALVGAAWPFVPLALLASLAAHLWDVRRRMRH